jgi:hypothetical protein
MSIKALTRSSKAAAWGNEFDLGNESRMGHREENIFSNDNASKMLRDIGGYNVQKSRIWRIRRQKDGENSTRSYRDVRKCVLLLCPGKKSQWR